MGDGVVKKYGIIINEDTETRHLANVNRSARVLKKGGYQIHVASPSRPSVSVYRHVAPTLAKVRRLIAGIKAKIDDDDVLVIYNTGHGENRKEFCLKNSCVRNPVLKDLDSLKYGQRVFVIDSCYGGNLGHHITDNPKSLFVSAGAKGIQVCCNNFAPTFWKPASQIPDRNKDGGISWQERYDAAYKGHRDESRLFLRSKGFRDFNIESGRPARPNFPAKATSVNDHKQLKAQLGKLRPGEYAVLSFSMPGCTGCIAYKPIFAAMARKAGGSHLFLRTKSNALRLRYGISSVPRVVIIDAFGKVHKVPNIGKVFERLATINLSPVAIAVACVKSYVTRSGSRSAVELQNALTRISKNFSHVSAVEIRVLAPLLRKLFGTMYSDVYQNVVNIYGKIIPLLKGADIANEAANLRKLLNSNDGDVIAAVSRHYPGVVARMKPRDAAAEAAKIRTLFKTYPRRCHILAAIYADVFEKLSATARAAETTKLRSLFNDYSAQDAAIKAYGLAGRFLSSAEALKGAVALRALLKSSSASRIIAMEAYGGIAPKLTAAEAALGIKQIRTIITSGYFNLVNRGVAAYAKVAKRIDGTAAGTEVRALRSLFKDFDNDVRSNAYRLYGALAPKLSIVDTDAGAAVMRAAFKDPSNYVKTSAIIAYLALSRKMSASEAVRGAPMLRVFFADTDDTLRKVSFLAYAALVKKLKPAELLLGARTLRSSFKGAHGDVAAMAYHRAFGRLTGRQRSSEVKALLSSIRGCTCMANGNIGSKRHPEVRCAIDAFGYIAPRLSPSDAAKGIQKIRSLFWTKGDLHQSVVSSYLRMVKRLAPSALSHEAKRLRHLFVYGNTGMIVDAAVKGYIAVAARMSNASVAAESSHLRVLLKEDNIKPVKAAVRAFASIVPKLSGTAAYRAAVALRRVIAGWRGSIVSHAARSYTSLTPRLSVKYARWEARAQRANFNNRDSDVRKLAFTSYGLFADRLSRWELVRGARALRRLLRLKTTDPAVFASYCKLAPRLSGYEAKKAARLIRKRFTHREAAVRVMAAAGYGSMIPKLSASELKLGKRALLPLLKDPDIKVKTEAKKALTAIAAL